MPSSQPLTSDHRPFTQESTRDDLCPTRGAGTVRGDDIGVGVDRSRSLGGELGGSPMRIPVPHAPRDRGVRPSQLLENLQRFHWREIEPAIRFAAEKYEKIRRGLILARSSGSRRDASMRRLPPESGAGSCGQPPEANYRFLLRAWPPSVNQIPDRSKRLLFALSAAALILSDPNVSTYLRRAGSALRKIENSAIIAVASNVVAHRAIILRSEICIETGTLTVPIATVRFRRSSDLDPGGPPRARRSVG